MPASNLNNGAGNIAAGYGIGAGLQGFVDAYQNALNYQLKKSQAAAEAQYQDVMGQAATRHIQNEANELPIKEAEMNAKFLNMGGNPVAEYYGFKPQAVKEAELHPSPQVFMPQQAPQEAPAEPPKPVPGASEQWSGFIGPPRPAAGLIQPPAAQGPAASPSSPVSQIIGPGGKPQQNGLIAPTVIPEYLRNYTMARSEEAAKNQAESDKTGRGEKWGVVQDPQTGLPVAKLISQGPYSGEALLKQQTGEATLLNEKTNQRTGNMTVVNQFDDDPNTKAARASAVPMNQVVQYMNNKNPTPEQKQAAFMAALRVLDPNVSAGAKDVQQITNTASLNDRVRSILDTIKGSGMNDQILNGAISAAADSQIANTRGMMDASQKQIEAAKFRGNEIDPGLKVDSSVMRAYQGALKLKNQIGGNTLPSQRPNQPGLIDTVKSTFNELRGKPSEHPMSGKVVNYKGKNYNVDSSGNMTEIK